MNRRAGMLAYELRHLVAPIHRARDGGKAMLFTIQDWCPWCQGHMGWGGGWLMMLMWLVGLVVLVLVAWALVRGRWGRGPSPSDRDPAEEILREQLDGRVGVLAKVGW